jgi:hypothetical protein
MAVKPTDKRMITTPAEYKAMLKGQKDKMMGKSKRMMNSMPPKRTPKTKASTVIVSTRGMN